MLAHRSLSALLVCLSLAPACGEDADDTGPQGTGGGEDGGGEDGGGEDGGGEDGGGGTSPPLDHSDQLGLSMPGFALVDLNPASATAGLVVDSASLVGQPYVLLFLDSRCTHVPVLADDVWAELAAHPEWQAAAPVYAVESIWAHETVPETIDGVVEGNGLPYLLDTADVALWEQYRALNHDLFVVDGDGVLVRYEPLYIWPDDLDRFRDVMQTLADAHDTGG